MDLGCSLLKTANLSDLSNASLLSNAIRPVDGEWRNTIPEFWLRPIFTCSRNLDKQRLYGLLCFSIIIKAKRNCRIRDWQVWNTLFLLSQSKLHEEKCVHTRAKRVVRLCMHRYFNRPKVDTHTCTVCVCARPTSMYPPLGWIEYPTHPIHSHSFSTARSRSTA